MRVKFTFGSEIYVKNGVYSAHGYFDQWRELEINSHNQSTLYKDIVNIYSKERQSNTIKYDFVNNLCINTTILLYWQMVNKQKIKDEIYIFYHYVFNNLLFNDKIQNNKKSTLDVDSITTKNDFTYFNFKFNMYKIVYKFQNLTIRI